MARYQIREHRDGKRSYCGTRLDQDGFMHIDRHVGQMQQDVERALHLISKRDAAHVQRMLDRNRDPEPDGRSRARYRMTPDEYEATGRLHARSMHTVSRSAGDALKGLL